MNFQNYPNPQILFRQESFCGITWRGYLTRASLLAIGYGCYILLTSNKIDLSENGKRCFYAIREYFPHGKEGEGEGDDEDEEEREAIYRNRELRPFAATEYNDEVCSVCQKNLKTELLPQVPDVTATNKLLLVSREISKNINNIDENEYKNQTCTLNGIFQNGSGGGGRGDGDEPNNSVSQKNYLISRITWLDKKNYSKLSNYLIITIFSIIVVASMVSAKFQLVPNWLKFIEYGSIFDFLIPALIVMSTIYIWFIYQNSSLTIRRE